MKIFAREFWSSLQSFSKNDFWKTQILDLLCWNRLYKRKNIFPKNFLTKNNSGIWYYYFGIFGIPAKFWIPIPGIFGIFGIFPKIPGIGIFPKIPGIFVPGTGIPGMAHPKAPTHFFPTHFFPTHFFVNFLTSNPNSQLAKLTTYIANIVLGFNHQYWLSRDGWLADCAQLCYEIFKKTSLTGGFRFVVTLSMAT